ncbi:MAG: hypothetical protein ABSG14_12340 [Verrucomicrobiia bacterium]
MTNCVYAGTFTGSGSRASPSVACPGDLITFSAWVVDSGGTVTIMNTDGDCNVTTTTNSVSATPQWTWSVNGCSDSSRGQVCSVAFELPNPGTYTCNFTATVANCPDSPLQMNLSASATVAGLVVSNVSFTGTSEFNILQDNGSGQYSAPHWTPTNSSPVGYVANTTGAVTAVFAMVPTNLACGSSVIIRGDGPNGLSIPATTCTVVNGAATLNGTFSNAFPNQVGFLNPLTINWNYSGDDGYTFHPAGASANPVYITLTNPVTMTPNLYRTVLHLACSNPGATTSNVAVANTWALFAGPANVTTWNGQTLYYYEPGHGFAGTCLDTAQLLTNASHNGQCGAWAHLFIDSVAVNGAAANWVNIAPVSATDFAFLITNWSFRAASFSNTPPYTWKLQFATPNMDMVPIPSGNVYGDLTSLTGTSGQNSTTPAEKVFNLHFIVCCNGTYYDPSYGVTYEDAADFESKAVTGYGELLPGDNPPGYTNLILRVRQPSGSVGIYFDPLCP